MTSPGITEFLLARIAEDEAVARAATPSAATEHPGMGWNPSASMTPHGFTAIYGGALDEAGYRTEEVFRFADEMDCEECVRPSGADMQHIARWDPARVIARCEADREIVELAQDYSPELSSGDNGEWAFDAVLRHLALPYADHPDYDESWRP